MNDTVNSNISNEIKDSQVNSAIRANKTKQVYKILLEYEKGKKEILNLNENLQPEELAYNFCKQHNLDFKTLLNIKDKITNAIQNFSKNGKNKKENIFNQQINEKYKFNSLNEPILEDSEEQQSTEKLAKMKNFKSSISNDKNCFKYLINDYKINNENINPNSIKKYNTNIYKILNKNNYFIINKPHRTSAIIANAVNNCMEIIENEEKLKSSKIQMNSVKCEINKINDNLLSKEKNSIKIKDYLYKYGKKNNKVCKRNKIKEQFYLESSKIYSSINIKKTNLSTGINLSTYDNDVIHQNTKKNFDTIKSINHEIDFNILSQPKNNNKNEEKNKKYILHKCSSNFINKKNLFSYDKLYKKIKEKKSYKKNYTNPNSKRDNKNSLKNNNVFSNYLISLSNINFNYNTFSYNKINKKKNNYINYFSSSTKNLNDNFNNTIRKINLLNDKDYSSSIKNKRQCKTSKNIYCGEKNSNLNNCDSVKSNFNLSKKKRNPFYNGCINNMTTRIKAEVDTNKNTANGSCDKLKKEMRTKKIFDSYYFNNDNVCLSSYKKSKNIHVNQNSFKENQQVKYPKNNFNITSLTNFKNEKNNLNNYFNQTEIKINKNKLIDSRIISNISKYPSYNTLNKTKFKKPSLTKNLLRKNKISLALKRVFYYLSDGNNYLDKINETKLNIYSSVKDIISNCGSEKGSIYILDFLEKGKEIFVQLPLSEQIHLLNFNKEK